jgi:hypothetical protein
MSKPQYLAQVGHFLGGVVLLESTALFFGFAATYWALGLGTLVAGLKEFGYDSGISLLVPSWGEGDSWQDSAEDFAFYVLGGGAGMGLAAWAHHLGRC